MTDVPKLPIWQSLRSSWQTLRVGWRHLALLTVVLTAASTVFGELPWPNTCGAVLGETLGTFLVLDLPRQVAGEANAARADALARAICLASVRLPPAGAGFVLGVIFAVAWQRRLLLPGARPSPWAIFGWDWRKTKVAAAALLALVPAGVLLVVAAIAFAAGHLPDPFGAAFGPWAMLAVVLTAARFSLVFPALASDRGGHPGRAWRWTRGNYWRLVIILLLALLPFLALRYGLQHAAPLPGLEAVAMAARVAATAFGYLGLAAGATALALAYHEIRESLYEQAASANAPPGALRLRAGRTA